MDASSNLIAISLERGLDSGWPEFLAAAKAANPEFETNYGVERLAADYAVLPIKIAKAMGHATGHESQELFRIGNMLLIVQERGTYTIDDMAHVMSNNWVLPTGDLDLIDRVRDKMSLSCNFVEDINRCGFQHFAKHVDEPIAVKSFMGQLGRLRIDPQRREFSRTPILSLSAVKAVLCAEIWCAWACENRSPLPPKAAFVELFGPGMAVRITEFTEQLMRAFTCNNFKLAVLQRYGYDIAFLSDFSVLVSLVEGL
ncbi:hypothetical protein GQX73_g10019 [Xylaria multiplex]|uniref:Uncharacterized protein n=1 Tax=Xylaria multiplex TaxID=323545 RepID=A0A7C8ILR4_9PEZI|nr:hypothetical protein GQX73_g10019 [Xylaria multiplex]